MNIVWYVGNDCEELRDLIESHLTRKDARYCDIIVTNEYTAIPIIEDVMKYLSEEQKMRLVEQLPEIETIGE